MGRLRPRSAHGQLQAKPKRLFFVILVTHPKSYIETTDRRDSAANRYSEGEDGCYREQFRNFVAWVEPDKKNSIFRVFRVPFDCPAHSPQETVLPQTNGTDGKPRLWRCAFSRHLADIGPEGCRKMIT